jgi:transposase
MKGSRKMTPKKYSEEFKRQIVEEVLSGRSGFAQICRQHNLAGSMVHNWKAKYLNGTLVAGVTKQDAALLARIAELERMVGRLAMENEFLKKAEAHIREQRRKVSLPITAKTLAASKEGVNS